MTISIENHPDSGIVLLERQPNDTFILKISPGDKPTILAPGNYYFLRVPLVEPERKTELIDIESVKESIPVRETMLKNLDGHHIECFPEGEGGTINGINLKDEGLLNTPINEEGIIFKAT